MRLEERAEAARVSLLSEIADLRLPQVGDVVARLRRRRRQRMIGSMVLAGVVAAGAVLTVAASSTSTRVEVVSPSHELPAGSVVDGAWTSVPKDSAGITPTASLEALTATSDSLIAAGAGMWRSFDGLHWSAVTLPATGEVSALGAHGHVVLAVATEGRGSNVVARSTDDGKTFSVLARGPELFGAPAPAMGRPFVSSLRWSDAGFWIAAGGASNGYAGIWISPDGARWRSVLGSNQAGSVEIAEDGTGALVAHFLNQAWTSTDGRVWMPSSLSVPAPYELTVVGDGASIALGADPVAPHTAPTALLRSADHGRTWTDDPSFRAAFPSAVGGSLEHDNYGWVIAGFSSGPTTQHIDAWSSTNALNWSAVPRTLSQTPGGTLTLIGTVGATTVIMGGAPELDRYLVLDRRPQAPPASKPLALRLINWAQLSYPLDCQSAARPATQVLQVLYAAPAPGTEVAIVMVACAAGAGTPPRVVYVFDRAASPTSPHLLQTLSDDGLARRTFDRVTSSISVAGSNITSTGTTYSSPSVPRCCPDGTFATTWTWTGTSYQPS